MEANAEREPWFGLEQEYTFLGQDDRPYGWPVGGYPAPYVIHVLNKKSIRILS